MRATPSKGSVVVAAFVRSPSSQRIKLGKNGNNVQARTSEQSSDLLGVWHWVSTEQSRADVAKRVAGPSNRDSGIFGGF